MNDRSILDKVKVASPCHARWEDMNGDDRARFCGQCNKNVYNFSAMTSAEVECLIREKIGRLCGLFYTRPDGRMLTTDCPVGVRRKRGRLARICVALAGFALFIVGGCTRRPATPPSTTQGMVSCPEVKGKIAVMGDVFVPPPTNSPALLGEVSIQ